ncbi:hypothetical protein DAPPUDRAFT_324460 [Daphnia pulex]|uniref:HAT C-terminal dimerisation domain-containing protein n=1 Tax=Daphnia pulex TaxID=6669 RepID=E9H1S9_DAPPU|nr:hypothetical protein DAPPUDRAFT_324460 [Daphnia pulex]|eukprot:EFX74312.1 hypothetical protein DAPPUDRAFT_324460 [Daphnia pulex]
MSKRKSTSNNGEQLSRKPQSLSKSSNSAGKKRSLPINISIESDDENEMDDADADALPATSTEITNQSSSAPLKATSAASKRAFTVGKDIFGISRMSLKPETVEALICLRSWYKAGLVGTEKIMKKYD